MKPRYAVLRIVKILNILLMTLPFALSWVFYYSYQALIGNRVMNSILISLVFIIIYSAFCRIYDGLWVSYNRISETVFSQSLAVIITDIILYIIVSIVVGHFAYVVLMLVVLVSQIIVSAAWAYISHIWYFSTFPPKKTLVIYDIEGGLESLIEEYGFAKKFDVKRTVRVEECLKDLGMLEDEGIETVFLRGIHSHDRNIILKYCVERNISVFLIPRVGDALMSGAQEMHILHLPIMRTDGANVTVEYLFFKRLLDIILSIIFIIIMGIPMMIIAIAVKRDGGPVFYRQVRLTKGGREFKVIKFRSMVVDAEKDGVARLSTGAADPRVTKTGKVLRRYRIDEFPQIFNVLKGDMSIVGPRPERPEITEQYEKIMPEFRLRLQVKAGITGSAQVFGKYNTAPYDKLILDLMYVASPSIWKDIRICFSTIKVLFTPDSTEGVAAGQVTASQKDKNEE